MELVRQYLDSSTQPVDSYISLHLFVGIVIDISLEKHKVEKR